MVLFLKRCLHLVLFMVLVSAFLTAIDLQISSAVTVSQKVHFLLTKAEDYSKNKGRHDLALMICNKAIKLQPSNSEGYYRRAFVLGRMGDYFNAIKNFSLVIKKDEKNPKLKYPSARKFRGDCFMGLGYMQNAVDDYSAMLKRSHKSDKSGKIWFYMAEALSLMNKKKLSLQAIENGCATGSHWCAKMKLLQKKILTGKKIIPHKPLSN
ncbi:hypothetical protein DO021_12105 [Desulfobacter hydrogenophilus]|uniref:Uncharacterized protein n=1 Tax=Desulfobacter hydrogenophilus TaxID=2291 RepID=A0A328FBR6_9BACT|nr:tetratricopeptide repeat protein [Desulfobacter hydrogenophilus]NDY72407.1 hypothetical protein [Desulfobacter hydrogenophilus]QBH13731.1 hypothetical protein EYB58_12855 [Desulfobacter hydrogenophilus]RAM01676.1 hypothetical protein DO021_12105 [Desulfobacter hydrogenophilus]